MPPRRYEDDGYSEYSSDSSRPRHHRRHSSRQPQQDSTRANGFAKVALGVVFVEVVAACLSAWIRKRDEERDHERRRDKKRQFEKAKARRRRDENKRERQQEERERMEAERWADVEVHEVRRIGYGRPANDRARSESSRAPRRIEAPPELDNENEAWERKQRRNDSRSRSRPAVDVT